MVSLLSIFVEAIIVGISTVIMGLLVHYFFGYHSNHENSPHMKKEMFDLGITLFFTGFLLHLFFEVVGLNKYYITRHTES